MRSLDRLAEIADAALGLTEPEHGAAERGLARAAFADDAERLAARDRERDIVDRLDVADGAAEQAALDREPDFQRLGGDDRLDRRGRAAAARRAVRRRAASCV